MQHPSITKDFLKLRAELEKEVRIHITNNTINPIIDMSQGKFEPDMLFFLLTFAITVLLEVVAWWMLYFLGNTWITWTVSGTLFAVGQMQFGGLQHDLSHRSIFRNKTISRIFHDINLGLLQVSYYLCACTAGVKLYYSNLRVSFTSILTAGFFFSLIACKAYTALLHGDRYSGGHVFQLWDGATLVRLCHKYFLFQGVSINWWDGRHFRHHAKPNVVSPLYLQ